MLRSTAAGAIQPSSMQNYHDRIFQLGDTYNLTLNDMTLTHGKAAAGRDGDPGIGDVPDQDGGIAESGWQGGNGGAIYAQTGISLTLNRVAVIDNASGNGGNGGRGGNGGSRTTPGTGHAGGKGGNGGQSGSGGAIYSYNATVTVTDCVFSGNHTGLGGDGGTGGNGAAGMASSPSELGARWESVEMEGLEVTSDTEAQSTSIMDY